MLTLIDVKFPSSFACFSARSSGYKAKQSILQIADVIGARVTHVVFFRFLLFLQCFLGRSSVISPSRTETCEMSCSTKTTKSCCQGFSAIILCFWRHFPDMRFIVSRLRLKDCFYRGPRLTHSAYVERWIRKPCVTIDFILLMKLVVNNLIYSIRPKPILRCFYDFYN